jgi:1-acyl-sn-glycerol-3-phosphate acyltransferase
MSQTWRSDKPPPQTVLTLTARIRAALRGLALVVIVFGGLVLLLLLRLIERPLFGVRRPLTPWITQGVCRTALWIIGLRLTLRGSPQHGGGAVVANHSSWLDIFVLNAVDRVYFVSKSEVRDWPAIGWLARATGTVFITRDRRAAQAQTALFAERLRAGHRLLFFPEGTSTDGQRVLPFKSALFEAFLAPDIAPDGWVEPVSVRYHPPEGEDPRYYAWWGDMALAPHLLVVLGAARSGRVEVCFHPPVQVSTAGGRKQIAARTEAAVRGGFETASE